MLEPGRIRMRAEPALDPTVDLPIEVFARRRPTGVKGGGHLVHFYLVHGWDVASRGVQEMSPLTST